MIYSKENKKMITSLPEETRERPHLNKRSDYMPESKFRQKAVALKYNPDSDIAPKVVAKGAGLVAEKILERAEDIPIHQDAALVEDLTRLDLGDNIPPELYDVIAQVLVFISELDRQESQKHKKNPTYEQRTWGSENLLTT